MDPREYCSKHGFRAHLDKAVSTAQQLASKGPLRPVHRRRRFPSSQGELPAVQSLMMFKICSQVCSTEQI